MSTLKSINIIHPSGSTTNIVNDSSGNITVGNNLTITGSISGNPNVSGTLVMGSSFMRNRIINGAMVIDQRNAGASVTPNNTYTLDRWQGQNSQTSKYTIQQSSTAPTGFNNSLLITSSSAYSVVSGDYFFINQPIEGFNTADLAFGTANASTVTISFWVRSSLTGTFGGTIRNYAVDRSYAFSYTISAANTWEKKTVTIAGDTSGTWVGATNSVGMYVTWCFGAGSSFLTTANTWTAGNFVGPTGQTSVVGTNGATFYITGVQLEVGSVATPFEREIYTQTLAKCQRYLPAFSYASGVNPYMFAGMVTSLSSSTIAWFTCQFPVTTRVPATGVTVSAASHFAAFLPSTATTNATGVTFGGSTSTGGNFYLSGLSGLTAGNSTLMYMNNSAALIYFTGCEL